MKPIVEIHVRKLIKLLQEQGIELILGDDALSFLAQKGYNPVFGARPLKRAIQKELQDPIAEEVVKGAIGDGSAVEVIVVDGALTFEVGQINDDDDTSLDSD